ncbi:MAG: N-acetylglucosamine-6-phosphate deacetylase [Rhodopirellula sp.]|nr:N-acetylglucosamine-6-phosphate deacetylase [Rhodopirellula sp.]OUX51516.1 MAG: N-acetylglucosamine-6-phosphate deacetylase [Rhodopirellula sp. TMED283]
MSGYIDLQVNGYAGVDFNSDHLSTNEVVNVCRRLKVEGTDSILATVITARLDLMLQRIARLVELIQGSSEIAACIRGIHVEGPFLNPADGFIGAHPASDAMPADISVTDQLLEAGNGSVKMVTLAPEMDSDARVTRHLTNSGIVVAAGHSNASLNDLQRSIDQGLKLFTHLGNGCPGSLPRHDNIVQRVLAVSDQLKISFIADGHHVPAFALRNYLGMIPSENIVIVTDAISAAGLGPGRYELSGQVVEVDDDGAAWAACRTHYAGCASTFQQMIEVLKGSVGVSDEQIRQWMITNPLQLLAVHQADDE